MLHAIEAFDCKKKEINQEGRIQKCLERVYLMQYLLRERVGLGENIETICFGLEMKGKFIVFYF
jgi:hypothetical protein